MRLELRRWSMSLAAIVALTAACGGDDEGTTGTTTSFSGSSSSTTGKVTSASTSSSTSGETTGEPSVCGDGDVQDGEECDQGSATTTPASAP
ncbi:MAG: hypothetical protein R3B09_23975 [Nannocystaceae bacterium]